MYLVIPWPLTVVIVISWLYKRSPHLTSKNFCVLDSSKSSESFRSQFLQADRIYSSPFTRAIETAIVALEGHPALKEYGLTLCR